MMTHHTKFSATGKERFWRKGKLTVTFLSPTTSGLTCEVKGSTKFNITVEPPE
jgi:hypothetical protein